MWKIKNEANHQPTTTTTTKKCESITHLTINQPTNQPATITMMMMMTGQDSISLT